MKKTILVILIALSFGSCTENERARNFGGTERITLPKGERLVTATWKEDNLWYLTEQMPEGYTPQTRIFKEKSSFGAMEGTVIFYETAILKIKLSNEMKSYLQILEQAAEKENIYGIVPDLRFRLDEQTMNLIEKAADIYALQKQGSINTNVVRPTSDLSEGGELLATEAQDTVAEAEEIKKAFDWLTPEKAAKQ